MKAKKYRNLHKRAGTIYYQRWVDGRRLRFSCETNDWDVAAQVRDLYEERRRIGLPHPVLEVLTFGQLADRYLAQGMGHLAATSRSDHTLMLRPEVKDDDGNVTRPAGALRRHFGSMLIDEVRRPALMSWHHTEIESRGRSPKTGKDHLDVLAAAFGLAVDLELLEVSPVDAFRLTLRRRNRSKRGRAEAAAGRSIRPVEPVEAVGALVAAARQESQEALVFVLLCLDAGLRHGEAAGLRWDRIAWGSDANDETRHLLIDGNRPRGGALEDTKSGRARQVALSRRLRAALRELYVAQGQPAGGALVLPDHEPANFVHRTWSSILKRAELKRPAPTAIRPKDLRDTFASYLLTAGVQLGYVSRQLGHSDVGTTARHYARWAGGDGYRAPLELRSGDVPADLLARLVAPTSAPTAAEA